MDIVDTSSLMALTLGAGWASGLNLYATVVALGWPGRQGTRTCRVSSMRSRVPG